MKFSTMPPEIEQIRDMIHGWIDRSQDWNWTLASIRKQLGSRAAKFDNVMSQQLRNSRVKDAAKVAVTIALR